MDLATLTILLNLVLMAIAEWLGFYIATRSVRSLTSWLATLTLWALGAFFLYHALTLRVENIAPFAWLWTAVILVPAFWIHLTTQLLPAEARVRGSGIWYAINRAAVPLLYLIALVLVVLGSATDLVLQRIPANPPALTDFRLPGVLYAPFVLYVLAGGGLILRNVWYSMTHTTDPAVRGAFQLIFAASLAAAAGGFYFVLGTQFIVPVPGLIGDILFGAGVLALGIAVARYAALLEGRVLDRDFVYTALVVGSLTTFYALVMLLLALAGAVSFLALALTMVGTIAANSLFDGARFTLDRIFYQGEFQSLRANLRMLAEEAGTAQNLQERLQAILNSLCQALHVQQGFVALEQDGAYRVTAAYGMPATTSSLPATTLQTADIIGLPPGTRPELAGMQMLVPLVARERQVGALLVGKRVNNAAYGEHEVELLDDVSDQIAQVIQQVSEQEANASQLNHMVQEFRERERELQLQVQQLLAANAAPPSVQGEWNEESLTPLVEDALRHLQEIPYLGEHILARMQIVAAEARRRGASDTTVERGKALYQVLLDALERQKPDGPAPRGDAIPREWHPYFILYDSYVEDIPNRDIMSKLYIGEGTFNRTRRRALRALAKTLAEMEARMPA